MQKILIRLFIVGLALASANASAQTPESFTSYVNTCKQQLVFTDANIAAIASSLNCTKGVLFAPNALGPDVNDYMGYARVTDDVDLVFACRWLTNGTGADSQFTVPPFVAARTAEMIITNRQSGKTCFFNASAETVQGPSGPITGEVPVALVSPTVAAAAAPNTPEANFWDIPIEVDLAVPCIKCHVAGPYIATPRIAPFLAQFGLLNNRHDTLGLTRDAQDNIIGNYRAVGSTFNDFIIVDANINVPSANTCADGCHSIGYNSDLSDMHDGPTGNVLLPSILSVIDGSYAETPDISVSTSGVMKPYADDSNYRWINLDTPGDGVETENFADALNASGTPVPTLLQYCGAPSSLEAHAVGIPGNFAFSTAAMSQIPDHLRTFNLKEGLVCLNNDQEPGHQCSNYAIRYLCSANTSANTGVITATWSSWYNTDSPTLDGDHEERSRDQNICGGATPIGIQAQVNGSSNYIMGPNDRLARFSPYGLTCKNSDQVDGKCSNYVVRYRSCVSPPPTVNRTLTNVYAVGKQVTAASGSLAKGQSHNGGTNQQWDTQLWTIAPVTNTEYVRLKNTSSGGGTVYLNVANTADQTAVTTAPLNSTATGEMWTIETVSGSSGVRLKNLFSGLYLTIADPKNFTSTPDYLPIYSQGLNTGWTSQLWIIQ